MRTTKYNICLAEALQIFGFDTASSVTEATVRERYHKLALKHHPDKGGDATVFAKVAEAKGILMEYYKDPYTTARKSVQDFAEAWFGSRRVSPSGRKPTGPPFAGGPIPRSPKWADHFETDFCNSPGETVGPPPKPGKDYEAVNPEYDTEAERRRVVTETMKNLVKCARMFALDITINYNMEFDRYEISRIHGVRLYRNIWLGHNYDGARWRLLVIIRERDQFQREHKNVSH